MKYTTLRAAIAEAKRFVATAEELAAATDAEADDKRARGYWDATTQPLYVAVGTNAGATRRASMDLTRKLADLRCGR